MDSKKTTYLSLGLILIVAALGISSYILIVRDANSDDDFSGNFGEAGVSDLGLEGSFIEDIPFEEPPEDFPLETEPPEETAASERIEDEEEVNTEEEVIDADSVVFVGDVISGEKTQFIDFNTEDFEKAVAAEKLVVLYFYANWCPICRAEVLVLADAFEEINSEKVVGFRVNFEDDATDDSEKELAKKHSVVNQHTKVIIKPSGASRVEGAPWPEKEDYIRAIQAALENS